MSIAVLRTTREPREPLLTVADVAKLPSELPSGTVRYELDGGKLVIMAPSGEAHGRIEVWIASALLLHGELRGFGKTYCGDVGIVLRRAPDRLVGADAAFIAIASLPVVRSREGYLETIPDLVVEVRSKNDSLPECEKKVQEYLHAGVKVVWLADAETRTVTAYRRDMEPRVFTENDTLTIEDIIPGFQLAIREVFQE